VHEVPVPPAASDEAPGEAPVASAGAEAAASERPVDKAAPGTLTPSSVGPPPGFDDLHEQPLEATTTTIGSRLPRGPVLAGAGLLIVLAIVAVVLLTSGGSSSSAAYSECRTEVQPVLAAMQDLGGHLEVGLNESEYSSRVGDLQATYNRLGSKQLDPACKAVALSLGQAMDTYANASSEWNECIVVAEEECDGSVQEQWSEADEEIAQSKKRLAAIQSGGDAAEEVEAESEQIAEDSVAKEQAHTALIALETYATENKGSYEGATPEALKLIEPSLPSGLTIYEAGLGNFDFRITTDGGDWFQVKSGGAGQLSFECGKSGSGGCPASGHWG
jgi:hypothetical protein